MWHDLPFSQRNKATKKALGFEVGGDGWWSDDGGLRGRGGKKLKKEVVRQCMIMIMCIKL